MAIPAKTTSVSFTSTTLSDRSLPITSISKTDLQNFLNNVQDGDSVTFFFASTVGASKDMYLVLAENRGGVVSSTNQLQSSTLPCPPYCK